MSVIDILIAARKIAEEAGVEWTDLDSLAPYEQVAAIRSRVAHRVIVLREEALGITKKRQQAAQRIAA